VTCPRSFLAGFLLLSLSLTACRTAPSPVSAGQEGLVVAEPLRAFWERGGGLATYGPPISLPWREGTRLHQTFLAAEIVHEDTDGQETVRLAPLGWELGLGEPPVPPIDGQTSGYFARTGHNLYAGFASLYRQLGGEAVVGAPISEVAFRDGQIVQYFENLGFYRPENASPADTRLVALGLTTRPPADSFGLDPESFVLPGPIHARPFASFLERFGGEALFGQPLTAPYLAEDGALEQVYERAVVYSADGSSAGAALRPLGRARGPAAEAAPPSAEPGSRYFEETGHNVRWAFADFYEARDGRSWLGLPLEEAVLDGDRFVQRFENGVLEYRFDLPPELAVQLVALGREYLLEHPAPTADPAAEAVASRRPGSLTLEAALARAVLRPGQAQVLSVRVTTAQGEPVAGATVTLRWIGAQREREYELPPTDGDGRTALEWEDPSALPGEIITVVVSARGDQGLGGALLQYASAYPARR